MAEQFGDKTFDATPQRRQKAREQGQVARSQDLTSALLLIAGVILIMTLGGSMANWLGDFARRQLGSQPVVSTDQHMMSGLMRELIVQIARFLLPVLGLMLLTAVLSNIGQFGFLFLPTKLAMDPNHVNPLKGVQRLFSMNSAVRLGFGIFKVLVVGAVGLTSLMQNYQDILDISGAEPLEIATFVVELVLWTSLKIGGALLILAIMDFMYQKWKYEQDLKMTHQEVQEEVKNMQGDPQIVARRKAVQRQMALNRVNNAVPDADVVVTNPTELAIALKYNPEEMQAPIVVAKGAGMVAQRIRRLALESGVPIVERKELARALYKQVEINQPIPAEQYTAMAEVLRYVYELKGKSLTDLEQQMRSVA